MKLVNFFLALLIFSCLCLVAMAIYKINTTKPQQVLIIGVGRYSSECFESDNTLIQYPDGTRRRLCGIWGKPGDIFNSI